MIYREIDSRLLLALNLLKYNVPVIFGWQDEIRENINKFDNSVYFDKSLSSNKYDFFKELKKLNYDIISNDEEGNGFYDNPWIYLRQRVNDRNLKLCYKYILWSKDEEKFFKQYIKSNNYIVMGNPRVDIWRNKNTNLLYEKDIKDILRQYERYSIITTNFGYPHCNGSDFLLEQAIGMNLVKDNADAWYFRENLNRKRHEYNHFLKSLDKLVKSNSDKKYILRPHPSEHFQKWEELMSKYPNVKVVYSKMVIPWLLSAEKVYTGFQCTTGYESVLLGKDTYEMQDIYSEIYDFKEYKYSQNSNPPINFSENFSKYINANFIFERSTLTNMQSLKCNSQYEKQKWPGFDFNKLCEKAQILNNIFNIGLKNININKISENMASLNNNN